MAEKSIKGKIIVVFAAIIAVCFIDIAAAGCWACDGPCEEDCEYIPNGCTPDPDNPGACSYVCHCLGSGCVNYNPVITYSEDCPAKFDWSIGNLESAVDLLGEEAVIEQIVENLDEAGFNIGTLSSSSMELFASAVEDKFEIAENSLNIEACIGNEDACAVDSSGVITIRLSDGSNSSLNLDNLDISRGSVIEAIIDDADPPVRFDIHMYQEGTTILANPDGSSQYFISHEGGTISLGPDGNWLSLPTGASYTYTSADGNVMIIYVPADADDLTIYHGNLPAGEDGVGISGSNVNGDGVEIRNSDVVISHESDKGKFGITTGNMSDGEYVIISKPTVGDMDYSADLRQINTSDVTLTTGLQGIALSKGEMWACNPIVGSCPYDNESNLAIDVIWKEVLTYTDDFPPYLVHTVVEESDLQMFAQDRLFGKSFSTCTCDNRIECDEGCGCDIICPLVGAQDWLWVVFGYGEYLKHLTEEGAGRRNCNEDSDCAQSYGLSSLGKGYHLYEDGEIVDSEYRNKSAVLIYDQGSSLIKDNCQYLSAYAGIFNHCINAGTDTGNICPKDCSALENTEKVCSSCLISCANRTLSGGHIKCSFSIGELNKIYYLPKVEYDFDADDPNKEDDCNRLSRIKMDFYCPKHCGYCNDFPWLDIPSEKLNMSVNTVLTVNLHDYTNDKFQESVSYQIISQSHQGIVDCNIGQMIDEDCSGDTGLTYEPYGLLCRAVGAKGTSEIEIKISDECGLDNHDDEELRYQTFTITVE